MEWNGHCTHVTHVGSAVQSTLNYLYDSRAITRCGYASQPQQLHEQHALLYFLSWAYLYSVCSFCSAVSAAQLALLCLIPCFLSSSIVCSVIHGSLQEHNGDIATTSEASLRQHDGSISINPLRTWLRLPRNTRA